MFTLTLSLLCGDGYLGSDFKINKIYSETPFFCLCGMMSERKVEHYSTNIFTYMNTNEKRRLEREKHKPIRKETERKQKTKKPSRESCHIGFL